MLQNPRETKDEIVQWIREYFQENGPGCTAVIGISGGKDSSIAAALCAEALGKDRVLGVLMPNGEQSDIEDARALVKAVGIPSVEINIGASYDAMLHTLSSNTALGELTQGAGISSDTKINLAPRYRMATLYAIAQMLPGGGRVVNTCNFSEDYVGYSTKFGDAAGDFSPLSDLLVEEVKQIGSELHLPHELIFKTPSDGLSGLSDEDKLGFTYDELGEYIKTGSMENEEKKAKIDRLHRLNLHKLKLMPKYELKNSGRVLNND